MVQHHDSVPSLNCTAISIDSPHMHRDGANYLNLLLQDKIGIWLRDNINKKKQTSISRVFALKNSQLSVIVKSVQNSVEGKVLGSL